MKKLLFSMLIAAAALSASAQAKKTDPVAPYHDYGPAMQSTADKPLTSFWQKDARKTIDDATTDAVLASFVADEESARLLLLKLDGAFTTDALTLTQIASVSQWVMLPDSWYNFLWDGPHAAGRKVWTEELLELADESDDSYVKIFCLEQLRLCAYSCQIEDIIEIGAEAKDKNVRAVAELVARSLKKR